MFSVICFSMNGDVRRELYSDRTTANGRAEELQRSGGRVAFVTKAPAAVKVDHPNPNEKKP